MSDVADFDPQGDLASAISIGVRTGRGHDCDAAELPASWLRHVIVENPASEVHAKGIRLVNARIVGRLDLESVDIPYGVTLERCQFDVKPCVVGASLRELNLSGSQLPGLEASGVRLVSDLSVDDATIAGTFDVNQARIGGQLSALRAKFNATGNEPALAAQNVEIRGHLDLFRAHATGTVDLQDARIGGAVGAVEAQLHGSGGPAVMADRAEFIGGILLDNATITDQVSLVGARLGLFSANGERSRIESADGLAVAAAFAQISGSFIATNARIFGGIDISGASIAHFGADKATIDGNGQPALTAAFATLESEMQLREATITGTIHVSGATMRGTLYLDSSTLNSADQFTLKATETNIGGSISLSGATSHRQLELSGAQVGGQFQAVHATLNGAGTMAVRAQGARFGGNLDFTDANVNGQLNYVEADIGGQFNATRASFNGGGQPAVFAQRAEISHGMHFTDANVTGPIDIGGANLGGQFIARGRATRLDGRGSVAIAGSESTIKGGMHFDGAAIIGALDVNRAKLGGQFSANDCGIDGVDHPAIMAQFATIDGGIFLTDSLIVGGLNCVGSTMPWLMIDDTSLHSAAWTALSANSARIGTLTWRPRTSETELATGVVDLSDCAVKSWEFDPKSIGTVGDHWRIGGFTYNRVDTGDDEWNTAARISWLNSALDTNSPGPFEQMASVLRREGRRRAARDILIAGNRHLQQGFSGQLRRMAFGWTISYGYQPWRALWFLVPLLAALALLVAAAPADPSRPADAWMVSSDSGDSITAADDCDGEGPCLQPVVYALDTVLPIVDFGQADEWTVNRSPDWAWTLALLAWAAVAAGWIFGVLLAAAAGGLVRQV